MPVPIDLAGVRPADCRYVVVRPTGRLVPFGGPTREWECRCDCGAVFALPQKRIPYAEWIRKARGKAVYACDACDGNPCVVCGVSLPRSSMRTACEGACEAERQRRAAHASYRRNAEAVKRRSLERQKRERAAGNPVYKAQDKRKWARVKADPERLRRNREQARAFYAENAERIQAERKARLTALTTEQLAERRAAWREYQRRYAAKRRAVLHADPELHARYLEYLRRYRKGLEEKKPRPEPKSHGPCRVCGTDIVSAKAKRVICDRPECRREYHRRVIRATRGKGRVDRVCPHCEAVYAVHGEFRKRTCGRPACVTAAKTEARRRRRADKAFWELIRLETELGGKT